MPTEYRHRSYSSSNSNTHSFPHREWLPNGWRKKQRIVYEQGRFEARSKLEITSALTHTHQVLFSRDTKGYFEALRWRLASVNADRGVLTSFDKVKWDKFQSKAEEIEKSISVKRLNSFSGFLHNRLRRQCADINSDQNTKPAQKRATFSQLRSSSSSPHRRRHLYEKSNFSHIPSE